MCLSPVAIEMNVQDQGVQKMIRKIFYPTDIFNGCNGFKCPNHITQRFRRGNPRGCPFLSPIF